MTLSEKALVIIAMLMGFQTPAILFSVFYLIDIKNLLKERRDRERQGSQPE